MKEMKEFNLDDFCRDNDIPNGKLEPYNYEKYKAINPNLTESMYRRMRIGGVLWKVSLGIKHIDKFSGEVLNSNWRLQMISRVR